MSGILGNDWLDWLLNIAVVLAVGSFVWRFIRSRLRIVKQFDINQGNQSKLIHSVTVEKEQMNDITISHNANSYDSIGNAINEYTELLFDNMAKEHRGEERSHEFWLELTRGQKVFWTYLVFEGEVDNGGLFQFMHNSPEHLYAARQMMVELKQERLLTDYNIFLKEVEEKRTQLRWNTWRSNNPFYSQQKRLQAFSEGYKILKTPEIIEAYFYEDDFKGQWRKAMCDYIKRNADQYAVLA
ncbi:MULTISPECIES: DUF4375 domain-containing protein [unclassified Spirosoma]|uniref:DMP19 family protein n=1 Tax=unclassified Spirosoma TaxID=2621999 RepID=UPI000967A7C9|nr:MULTISPECIES: DUF4375 domain-containing protein [unclassified Spirosoma]MBN8826566.1 DUF4375 domain-containing protein [Spirosoma sp.]OJW71583.1 MAG: hypothetical protein BGO59_26775 [Spirosoma sp. 48-14]